MEAVTVVASGCTVTGCCARAREHLGLPLKGHREVFRSGGEDGLYRSELECGTIVESIMVYRQVCKVLTVDPV